MKELGLTVPVSISWFTVLPEGEGRVINAVSILPRPGRRPEGGGSVLRHALSLTCRDPG